MQQPTLKRGLSLTLLMLYGLGTTVGAGIYVLVGKVAGQAGAYAPLSFLLAAFVAAPTALSFGALAARYPKSAGEAIYVEEAFHHARLSMAVGLAVVFVGLVSSGAIIAGAVGYLQNLVALPGWLGLLLVTGLLGAVAAWGISESVLVAAAATLAEIGGLLLIVWLGRDGFDVARIAETVSAAPPLASAAGLGILSGAVLAFYAFIGFEDMVNVSEEVRDPSRNMPLAITLTLVVTTILYVLVSWVSVTAIPAETLAASAAPMSDIFERLTGLPTYAFDVMVVAAVTNGALVQIIMAARVLYGLAQQGWLPRCFAHIGARTRTPVVATAAATVVVFILAATFPLEALARTTACVTLLIFALVNASFMRLRPSERRLGRPVSVAIPALGLVFSLALAGFQVLEILYPSGAD